VIPDKEIVSFQEGSGKAAKVVSTLSFDQIVHTESLESTLGSFMGSDFATSPQTLLRQIHKIATLKDRIIALYQQVRL
jgi:hypothetical protein